MAEKIQKLMNDNWVARWSVLVLVALMMFFAYMFVDVMSPLKSLVETNLGWSSAVFGKYAASEYILNVCGFLILAGIILDKLGVRFSGILSAGLMVLGAAIKFVGVSDWFQTTGFAQWLGSWWVEMPASAKMASLGFSSAAAARWKAPTSPRSSPSGSRARRWPSRWASRWPSPASACSG